MAGAATPKSVLVVEDNRSTRDIVIHNLSAAGYRALEAADGEQAVQVAAREPVDLVLLDVMMPKLDGFEVCRLLRRAQATANIPIIIVTARNEREDVVKAVEAGATDYIVKPFTKETLLSKVRRHLGDAAGTKKSTKRAIIPPLDS